MQNHWEALERPSEAGFLEPDNGACERAFMPVAIGRGNGLFAGSGKEGQTAAILMGVCTRRSLEGSPGGALTFEGDPG
jgi:transposase